MDEAPPLVGGPKMGVLLCARRLHLPDLLPQFIELIMDGVDPGMVGGHRVPLCDWDVVLLDNKRKTEEKFIYNIWSTVQINVHI